MIPTENDEEQPEYNKGSIPFDARQPRAKLLLNLTILVLNAHTSGDYRGQVRGLEAIDYLCFAFVDPVEAVKVKDKLTEVKAWINNKQVNQNIILSELDELTRLIMLTYKDQFMQLMAKQEESYDPSGVLE